MLESKLSESLIKGKLFNKKVSKHSPQLETTRTNGQGYKTYQQIIPVVHYRNTINSFDPSSKNSLQLPHGNLVRPTVAAGGIDQTPVEEAIPTERKEREESKV